MRPVGLPEEADYIRYGGLPKVSYDQQWVYIYIYRLRCSKFASSITSNLLFKPVRLYSTVQWTSEKDPTGRIIAMTNAAAAPNRVPEGIV